MKDAVVTYYDSPVLKEPVWEWYVPTYFYVGAAAGASLALGAAVQALKGDLLDLVRRCRWMGVGGIAVGSALLTMDLGRPERFYNMLRVFRPTSPMNVGTWLLSATGSFAGLAAVSEGGPGSLAGLGAGVLGIPLSGYTGVLLANTAVPVWQSARRALPVLFVASGMASAGALFHLMNLSEREETITRRFAIAGQAAELAAMIAVERETSKVERVAEPLKNGKSGFLWNVAKVLGAASLVLSLFSKKSSGVKTAAGLCGTVAAVSLRFAVLEAGRDSARDPRATFEPQLMQQAAAIKPARVAA